MSSKYTTREQDGYGNLFENDTLIYTFDWIQDADFAKDQLDKKDKQIAELQSEIEYYQKKRLNA